MAINIDPVTGLQNASLAPAKSGGSQDMSSVDFMKLIIAQMRNQNPLDPQSDTDFMAQMAQFEALNQSKAATQTLKVLQGLSELGNAAGLIGKTVTGRQVSAIGVTRDSVARERFGAVYSLLTTSQKSEVNLDDRVQTAIADAENAGTEVAGVVDRVIVGPDGIPVLSVNGKVIDQFTISEVR